MARALTPSEKEDIAREILKRELGKRLEKRTLRVGPLEVPHEFDLVSEDGGVVGEVKTDGYDRKTFRTTRFPRAMLACRYLELANAPTKLVVFTDSGFYENFVKEARGLLLKPITAFCVSLSEKRVLDRKTLP